MSRIAALPRRDWAGNAEAIADAMTAALRTPWGTQRLFPIQAVSLLEAAECRGLFGAIAVGGGKTILSGLIPTVTKARRPLLIVPGGKSVRDKTLRELAEARKHWQIYPEASLQIIGYNKLSQLKHRPTVGADGEVDYTTALLWKLKPDVIVCDEIHKLKALRTSAVAKTFAEYMHQFPTTQVYGMTGTFCKDGLQDYAHLLRWTLKSGAPVPEIQELCEQWAQCLRFDLDPWERPPLDCLTPHIGAASDVEQARDRFAERLCATPGVIVSTDAYDDVPLTIRPWPVDVPPEIEAPMLDVKLAGLAPDGWPLANHGDPNDEDKGGSESWDVLRQLASGFYYRHDPWPPEDWFQARSAWCSFVRAIVDSSPYCSELEIRNACAAGHLDSAGVFERWRDLEPTFKIRRVTEWLSDHLIDECIRWAGKGRGGIVWVDHIAFGKALSEATRWRYFAEGGICAADRTSILDANGSEVVIASADACSTTFNLQHQWHRNLVTCPGSNPVQWEQMLGRTHRNGQTKAVEFDYVVSCKQHFDSMSKARFKSQGIYQTMTQPQKLLTADFVEPTMGSGPAWD